jgi:hypothetical protein
MQTAEVARNRRCNDAFCFILFIGCLVFSVVMTLMVVKIPGFQMETEIVWIFDQFKVPLAKSLSIAVALNLIFFVLMLKCTTLAAIVSLVVIELSLLGGCGYFLMHNSQFLGFLTLICFIAINT